MTAWLVVAAVALVGGSGLPGLVLRGHGTAGERIATALVLAGSACGMLSAVLASPDAGALNLPWSVPGGAFTMAIDGISALFLIQIFVIAALGSIYGLAYWREADHPENGRKLRLFYGLMTAGMAIVVVGRDGVLFLVAWEIMALAAFFTLAAEDHLPAVREGGYLYLLATRLGTLCLLAMFVLLHAETGTFKLVPPPADARLSTGIFLLCWRT